MKKVWLLIAALLCALVLACGEDKPKDDADASDMGDAGADASTE